MSVQENPNGGGAPEASRTLTARDLLWMCLSRWYWFVISLAVCLGLAVWYILRTPPVYERSASLLIKDDRLGGTAGGDVGASFTGMGFLQANTNVLNELASITSPTVMREVVSRLGLDVSYTSPGTFHARSLYGGSLPLLVSFPDLGEGGDLLVTPKDIDSQVSDLAKVIGFGLSMALQPGMSEEELELLLS